MFLYSKLKKALPSVDLKCPCSFKAYDKFLLASKQDRYNIFVEVSTKKIVAAYFGSEELIENVNG